MRTKLLADSALHEEAAAQSDRLTALVERAFPSLRLDNRRVEQSGGDHVLLIVDDRLVFRFPRDGMHGLGLEIAVLRQLAGHSPIATPAYQYVDPAGRFAGYRFIEGSALTSARFAQLPQSRRHDFLATAARFLAALHGLPAKLIAPLQQWPSTWTPRQYADRGLTKYLPVIAKRSAERARAIEAFYDHYRQMTPPGGVVVHGDLVSEHFLLDEQTEQLCGVIDFSDVALGDPAQDFLGFWTYGADAARRIVQLYQPSLSDPDLLARSRDHFIRYRLDRTFESLSSGELNPITAETLLDEALKLLDPKLAPVVEFAHGCGSRRS